VGGLIKSVGDLVKSVGKLGGAQDGSLPKGAPAITPSNAWQVSYEAEARRNRLMQRHKAKNCE
jgi:hypothetical protein